MNPPMRAILVSVDYSDLLKITLWHNRHHFSEVCVVSTPCDESRFIAENLNCAFFPTVAFFDDGALFNKWKALEEGLDFFGRHGLLCIMDADVLWPSYINHPEYAKGYLYTPFRRMLVDIDKGLPKIADESPQGWHHEAPPESCWGQWPLHRQQREFAGFTQIFHADDPHLPPPPWHQIDWKHAGGADSFFQSLWPEKNKIRPGWECLHLGEAGKNWAGRATPYLGGGQHPQAHERTQQLRRLIRSRTSGPNRFAAEKLPRTTGEPPR